MEKYLCSECGSEHVGIKGPCVYCGSYRIIIEAFAIEHFGENYRLNCFDELHENTVELHVGSAGMGVNTVAYIIECTKAGIIFHNILFADPGKENPLTYAYIPILNKWLSNHGQPEITIVRNVNKDGIFVGLYQDCLNQKMLPSIAYGFKSCSQKWKKAPQDKFLNNWLPAKKVWENGGVVLKYLGYDADESHRTNKIYDDKKYKYVYKLVELDMGRFECVQVIIDAGLPLPPKSSCTFCPSMKPWEIIELYESQRKEFYDAIVMERNAEPNLTTVIGLGRDYRWWDLIVAYRYLQLVMKHKQMGQVPNKIKKLMAKINRSKPINYEKVSRERNAQNAVCDLFKTNIEMPCDCMN